LLLIGLCVRMCRNDLEEERIGYTNYEDEEVFIKVNDS
jgi:hypothetical protein